MSAYELRKLHDIDQKNPNAKIKCALATSKYITRHVCSKILNTDWNNERKVRLLTSRLGDENSILALAIFHGLATIPGLEKHGLGSLLADGMPKYNGWAVDPEYISDVRYVLEGLTVSSGTDYYIFAKTIELFLLRGINLIPVCYETAVIAGLPNKYIADFIHLNYMFTILHRKAGDKFVIEIDDGASYSRFIPIVNKINENHIRNGCENESECMFMHDVDQQLNIKPPKEPKQLTDEEAIAFSLI